MYSLGFFAKNILNFRILLNTRINRFGIALLVVPSLQLIASIFSQAQASEATISAGDNNLILTSSALVLLMTPGLAFFYGGLRKQKMF